MATKTVESSPEIVWSPNRGGQWLFLSCPYWEALADGDRGGGKTTSLLMIFLSFVGKGFESDWRGIIFRLTYPQLKDIIDISRSIIPKSFPGASYNKQDHEWSFDSGENLMFKPLENIKAYDNYHGHAYSFLGFEELTNWPDAEPYEAMLSCSRRRRVDSQAPLMVRSTTNAWGVGHSWVKQRFVTGRQPYVPYGDANRERVRIPIFWRENEKFVEIDPDYHARLADTISNEGQRKAWLENSWDIVAGGRFSGIWQGSLHMLAPFNIPDNWYVDRSHDWGSSKPFCTLWFAESNGEALPDGRSWPKGTLFVIDEDYGCEGDIYDSNWKPNVGLGLGPDEIAQRVKDEEENMLRWGLIGKKPRPGPADDPIFDVSRGKSMASIMTQKGVLWSRPSKGKGSRVTGWQLIENRLKASSKHPMEEPGLFVFDTCYHLIRTLPTVPRDPKNPDDVYTSSEDHAADALRLKILVGSRGASVIHGVTL